MRCWSVEVEIGGTVYEVPPLSAVEWWPVLTSGQAINVIDLLKSSPDGDLDDRLLNGEITTEELTDALTEAIEEVAGRPFHTAFVLATLAGLHWPAINGAIVRRGFRWDQQPLGAALDAVYSVVMDGLNEEEQKKLTAILDNPAMLPGGRRRKRDREKAAADFEALAGPRPTAGAVATGAPSGSAHPRTRPRPRPRRQGGPLPAPRKRP